MVPLVSKSEKSGRIANQTLLVVLHCLRFHWVTVRSHAARHMIVRPNLLLARDE